MCNFANMKKITTFIFSAAALMAVFSCGGNIDVDNPGGDDNPGNVTPNPPQETEKEKVLDLTKATLGDLAEQQGIRLGAAFTYWEYRNNPRVAEILTREFKAVTFGNEMKHDAIVQSSGIMKFDTADQMARWAKDAGAELFGHVLGWHSQQQTAYLNRIISQAVASAVDDGSTPAAPIDGGIDFEKYTAGPSQQLLESGEFVQINGPDYVSVTAESAHSGSLSLRMDNSDAHSVNNWDVQVVTKGYRVTAGRTYRLSWYARASQPADLQIDIRGDGDVQYRNSAWGNYPKTGTDWTYQSLEYTVVSGSSLSMAFFGATEAATYFIDDIQITPLDGTAGDKAASEAVDAAFKEYVYGMVEHFDVYAWDVVNETFADGSGQFRTRGNATNDFVWGNYYPSTKDWVDAAFAYAADACAKYGKTPVLYINDYNLETDALKRRAFCNYAAGNPQVTGVATQMHIDISTPDLKDKITACLKDLAATGKIVRISELDLKNNDEAAQADLFKYIFQQYLEIVPEGRRGGITFWGINDKDSWVGENNHPLLWKGANYDHKLAYEALYIYLCELNGIDPYTYVDKV
jgi:endo-1,4-beta-xylanase